MSGSGHRKRSVWGRGGVHERTLSADKETRGGVHGRTLPADKETGAYTYEQGMHYADLRAAQKYNAKIIDEVLAAGKEVGYRYAGMHGMINPEAAFSRSKSVTKRELSSSWPIVASIDVLTLASVVGAFGNLCNPSSSSGKGTPALSIRTSKHNATQMLQLLGTAVQQEVKKEYTHKSGVHEDNAAMRKTVGCGSVQSGSYNKDCFGDAIFEDGFVVSPKKEDLLLFNMQTRSLKLFQLSLYVIADDGFKPLLSQEWSRLYHTDFEDKDKGENEGNETLGWKHTAMVSFVISHTARTRKDRVVLLTVAVLMRHNKGHHFDYLLFAEQRFAEFNDEEIVAETGIQFSPLLLVHSLCAQLTWAEVGKIKITFEGKKVSPNVNNDALMKCIAGNEEAYKELKEGSKKLKETSLNVYTGSNFIQKKAVEPVEPWVEQYHKDKANKEIGHNNKATARSKQPGKKRDGGDGYRQAGVERDRSANKRKGRSSRNDSESNKRFKEKTVSTTSSRKVKNMPQWTHPPLVFAFTKDGLSRADADKAWRRIQERKRSNDVCIACGDKHTNHKSEPQFCDDPGEDISLHVVEKNKETGKFVKKGDYPGYSTWLESKRSPSSSKRLATRDEPKKKHDTFQWASTNDQKYYVDGCNLYCDST